jgi:fructokinase
MGKSDRVFVAIETGGTKILARLVDADGRMLAGSRWPTTTPERALEDLAGFVAGATPAGRPLGAIGIAAFGPVVRDARAPDYGRILSTPKPGWSGANLRAQLAARFAVPVVIDTDVNAAARAEWQQGAGKGVRSLAYVTVGTGIGGGLLVDGRPLDGALHAEIGHIRLVRRAGDHAPSVCPFHEDCVEGLVSGPALARRLRTDQPLADDPATFELAAGYLGGLAATLVLCWSPQRLVWGGGVMGTAGLLAGLRAAMGRSLGGYGVGETAGRPDFCVLAALEHAGLEGAVLMAMHAAACA